MIGVALRLVWRLMVFALLLVLTYVTFFKAFPFLDRRLPFVVAVLAVYIIIAYFVLPTIIRFWRLVIKPNHIPRYVTTPDGWPADPVNIAILAVDEKQLTKAMRMAGWYKADPSSFRNYIREGLSILFDTPYPTAPFSALFLFGRKFDAGYQKPRSKNLSARSRHHVRFWHLVDPPGTEHDHQYHFWKKYVDHLIGRDRNVWMGAAIDDTGPIGLRWRNLQITHKNDPNTNTERDLIIFDLENAGLVRSIHEVGPGEVLKFRGQTIGNNFISDGYIKVVELKTSLALARAKKTFSTQSRKGR